jgi:hypothetical protein
MLALLLAGGALLAASADAEPGDSGDALCLMSTSHFLSRELNDKDDLSILELGLTVGDGLEVEEDDRESRSNVQFLGNVEVSPDEWEAMVESQNVPVCPSAEGSEDLVIVVETPHSKCYVTHVQMFDEDDLTFLEDFFGDNVDMRNVAFYNRNVEIDPYTHHFMVEETTVVVKGWDLSGNSNKCRKKIRVVDRTPPAWSPDVGNYDTKITLEYPGNACSKNSGAVFRAYEHQTTFSPGATDNCKVKSYGRVVLQGVEPNTELLWEGPAGAEDMPDFHGPGNWTICYYAEDTHGNKIWHNITVEMIDGTPPDEITCPEGVFVEVEAGESSGYANWTLPRVITDNCFAHGVIPPPEEESGYAFDYYEIGETPISYTLKDAFNNAYEGECMFVVEVKPKAHPVVLTCPADVVVRTLKWSRFATVTWPLPTAEQGGKPLSQDHIWYEHDILPGSAFPYGTTVVTVHARGEVTGDRTREEDMTDSCTFRVHVVDEEAPQPDGRHFRCANSTSGKKKPFSVCGGRVVVPNLHHQFIDTHVFTTEGFHVMEDQACCDSELGVVHDCTATPSVMIGDEAKSHVKYCYPRELPTEQEACAKCVRTPPPSPHAEEGTPAPPTPEPEAATEEEEEEVVVIKPETTSAPSEPAGVPSGSTPAPEELEEAEEEAEATVIPAGPTPLPTHAGVFVRPTHAPPPEIIPEEEETVVVPGGTTTAAPSAPAIPSPAPEEEKIVVPGEKGEEGEPSVAPSPEVPPEEETVVVPGGTTTAAPSAPAIPSPAPEEEKIVVPGEETEQEGEPSATVTPPTPEETGPGPEELEEEIVVPGTPLPTHEGTFEAPTHLPEEGEAPEPAPAEEEEEETETVIVTAGTTTAAPSVPQAGPAPAPAEEAETTLSCTKRLDLVLLLDASMSVDSVLRSEIKQFAKDLIKAVMDGGNSSQIGAAWFARDVGVVSELTRDKNTLLSELDIWNPDIGVTTETALALMRGKEMMEAGGRADAEQVILVIYDGKPTNVHSYKYANYSVDEQAEVIKAAGIDLAMGLVSSITGDKERAESRSRAWSHRSVVSSPWEQHLHTDVSVQQMLEHVSKYLAMVCHEHAPVASPSTWHPEGLPWQTLSCVEDVCGMLETTEEVDKAIKAVDEWRKRDYAVLDSVPDSMLGLKDKFDCMMHVADGVGNDHPWMIKHCNDELSKEPGFKESWLDPSPGISLHVTLVEQLFENVTNYDGVKLACPDGTHVIGGGCEALAAPFTVGISAHWGLNGDGASATSGWTCAYDGLKNPGFVAEGGQMMVRALCSEKVVVTGTNGMRSFSTQAEPQSCDRHNGRVIGGGCSTIAVEDTNFLTLAYLSQPQGGPVFGELKPINDGAQMNCASSAVYRMTSAICIQDPLEDDVYEVEAAGESSAKCQSGDFLVGGGCSTGGAPLSACLPAGTGDDLEWRCIAKGGGTVTATAVCLRANWRSSLAQRDAKLSTPTWFS